MAQNLPLPVAVGRCGIFNDITDAEIVEAYQNLKAFEKGELFPSLPPLQEHLNPERVPDSGARRPVFLPSTMED
eukprot:scaffold6247_cov256-Pinguiococcus_pyrenoidosus.AAC.9